MHALDEPPAQTAAANDDASPGAMVVMTYRCMIAGFSFNDAGCWDAGWRALQSMGRPGEAGALFGEFYGFVRVLFAQSQRPLSRRPPSCRGLCADEALALNMIASAQSGDFVGLLDSAAALLQADELGDVLQATQSLARALARSRLFVQPQRRGEICACASRRLH